MIVERKFHPIGQGAFYTEKFMDDNRNHLYNIVYDCGTSSDPASLNDAIERTYDPEDIIDIVFISHFHTDHYNGLDHLLRYCTVRNIIIPLVSSNDIIYTTIDNTYRQRSNLNYIPNTNFLGFVNGRANIITLSPVETNENNQDDNDDNQDDNELISIENLGNLSSLSWNSIISIGNNEWIFKPFNFRNSSRAQIFQNEISQNNISLNTFIQDWQNNPSFRSDLISIYRRIPGSLNTNSMTLYSGNEDEIIRGALYLGDYDCCGILKWRALENCYSTIFPFVKTIQIPHHGSWRNFNSNLLNLNQNTNDYVISFGSTNSYRHPSRNTLIPLIRSGAPLRLIDENSNTFTETL